MQFSGYKLDKIAGDEIRVVYDDGEDNTPLGWSGFYLFNGFTGFKI